MGTAATLGAEQHPGAREQVLAGLKGTDEGGAELVQLLTPEGERVDTRDYPST